MTCPVCHNWPLRDGQARDAAGHHPGNKPQRDNIIKMHVWIHGHMDTGKPDSIDVFEVDGKMHMQWYTDAIEEDTGSDLAEGFHEHLKRVDDSAWFYVRMSTEGGGDGPADHCAEVLGLVEPQGCPVSLACQQQGQAAWRARKAEREDQK